MDKATQSPKANTPEFWEYYMKDKWDANDGRKQTRLFAKYFLETVNLPSSAQNLLDVSCAKGDAIPEIHSSYPHLELFGQDISPLAIEEAKRTYGELAQFEAASFEDLSRQYDVILCSNTLEHFENNVEVAGQLLEHCKWLYILVPYMELRNGQRLNGATGELHVATFDEQNFQPLIDQGKAAKIRSWVRYTPGAWGDGPIPIWRKIKRILLRKPPLEEMRQVFFEVTRSDR